MSTERTAYDVAADYLERNREALVASWIDWVRRRVQTDAVGSLPERALRNHVPPVLASLARFVRSPIELAREELLGHLRLHGQIRRDQGYSLQEVLAEFDGLADLVTRGVNRALERHAPEASPLDVMAVCTRLAAGLRSVSFITVGTYGESDEERSRSLSSGLEEFARAIAHELRNPLNTLSLSLQLLGHGRPAEAELEAQVGVMQAAVRRAASLVDTIQTLAVAEGARTGERLVTLAEAVHGVVEEFREEAQLHGVDVRVRAPLPDVKLESMLVYIVLANLVGNAVKYADPGKPERWVELSATIVEEEHDSGFCELVVQDNGLGIPEELQARIFQRGFRAHPEASQGTGLGLFLVQRAVQGRGGVVELESAEGEGSRLLARMRCLQGGAGALSADRFSVESLMGRRSAELQAEAEGPALPDGEDEGETTG